jgi:hypothetical protein
MCALQQKREVCSRGSIERFRVRGGLMGRRGRRRAITGTQFLSSYQRNQQGNRSSPVKLHYGPFASAEEAQTKHAELTHEPGYECTVRINQEPVSNFRS